MFAALSCQPLDEQRFIEILNRSKPSKRGGTDGSNLYMIFLSPEYVRKWFLFATNFSLTHTMPPRFTEWQVFLLYKKGDTRLTSNHRPTSLLNSLYKLVSTHLVNQLSSHTLTHKLLHPSQHGGLPCHRTADHIHHITALQSRNTPAYHLYIDFNKAFNSIPRSALWSTLIHYNLPSQLISALQMLYHFPNEIPLINGETHHHFSLLRGFKQGCPLSPLLFNLYINIILWALPQHVPMLHFDTTHTFIDYFLLRTTSPTTAAAIFNFFDQERRQLGLDMNISNMELQAMHGASPVTVCTPSKAKLSTHSPNGTPHTCYKCLGVFFFTDPNPLLLYELLNNEIISFFNSLSHIHLSIHELVTITNLLLISTLNYRLLAHGLPPAQLCSLQHCIWKSLACKSRLSLATSPKDKHSSFVRGGLGLWDVPRFVHKSVVNEAIRHLMLDSPPSVHQAVLSAYFQFNPNPLQDRLVDAAHALQLDIQGFGVWNPALTQYLPTDSKLFVELSDGWVTAMVSVNLGQVSANFYTTWRLHAKKITFFFPSATDGPSHTHTSHDARTTPFVHSGLTEATLLTAYPPRGDPGPLLQAGCARLSPGLPTPSVFQRSE